MDENRDVIRDDSRLFDLFTDIAYFVVTDELSFKEEENKELEI